MRPPLVKQDTYMQLGHKCGDTLQQPTQLCGFCSDYLMCFRPLGRNVGENFRGEDAPGRIGG